MSFATPEYFLDSVWKSPVATFVDLATTYPTPLEGWTASVNDTNNTYRYDAVSTTWLPIAGVSSLGTYVVSFGRDAANTTNIWLPTEDGIFCNRSPFVLAYDSKLMGISVATDMAETWEAEVYTNANVRAGGIPLDANKIAQLIIAIDNSDFDSFDVDLVAGTEVGVFCRGTGINRPTVRLWFERTA